MTPGHDFPWILGRFFLHPCMAAHKRRNPCGEGVSLHNSQPKRRLPKFIHVKPVPNKIPLPVLALSLDWRSRLLWWGLVLQQHPETFLLPGPKLYHTHSCASSHVLPPQEGQRLCSFIPWNFQLQPLRTQTDWVFLFFGFFSHRMLKHIFLNFPKIIPFLGWMQA